MPELEQILSDDDSKIRDRCPFCYGTYCKRSDGSVEHSANPCAKFDGEKDPAAFVRDARAAEVGAK